MNLLTRLAQFTSHFALATVALILAANTSVAQCPVVPSKLIASDGASDDYFGSSIAINGTTAIVGAWHDQDNGYNSGSAYLFDVTTGTQLAKLLPSDGATFDEFGVRVGISGTTAIVGSHHDDDNGTNLGSAYLFDATTGMQLAKLLPSDGATYDEFGVSVAISGTTAIVGSHNDDDNGTNSGSAYLFDTTTGAQLAKLLASDGAMNHEFGGSVAISGTIAIVGAHTDDDNGFNSGSAYLFDTTTGMEIVKLLPSDGADGHRFGNSVGISGTTAIVGAFRNDDNGMDSGSAYLFDITTGLQIAKLLPSDGAADDFFGVSVAISGTTAIVGAFWDNDNGPISGSAYLFDISTGLQIAKLLASDGATADRFGASVGISDTTAVVGAWLHDDNGSDSGSAYTFCVPKLYPDWCNGDGGDQAGCTACPCGNNAAQGTIGGCINSSGTALRLVATGNPSVSIASGATNDLRFEANGAPAGAFCILTSGDGLAPGGMANPCFGMDSGTQAAAFDGLRCAIINTRRHGGRSADSSGDVGVTNSRWGGEGGPPAGIAVAGSSFVAGQTRYFQAIHQDDSLLVCMRGLNTSQAIEVTFMP